MENNTALDWLNALMEQRLSPDEKDQLNAKLKNDKVFREEFAFLINVHKAAEKERRTKWRTFYKAQNEPKKLQLWPIAVAASFLILIALAWWQYRPTSFSTPQEIYAEYVDKRPISLTNKSSGIVLLSKAQKQYNQGDFEGAFESLDTYLDNKEGKFEHLFYRAVAQRNIEGQERQAIKALEKLKDKPQVPDIDWEIALIYLKINELEKCLEILNGLIEAGGKKGKKAKKLKRDIQHFL